MRKHAGVKKLGTFRVQVRIKAVFLETLRLAMDAMYTKFQKPNHLWTLAKWRAVKASLLSVHDSPLSITQGVDGTHESVWFSNRATKQVV